MSHARFDPSGALYLAQVSRHEIIHRPVLRLDMSGAFGAGRSK